MALTTQQIEDFADAYDGMAAAKGSEADAMTDELEAGFLRAVAAAYSTLANELRALIN